MKVPFSFYVFFALFSPSTNAWSQMMQSTCSTDIVLSVAKSVGIQSAALGDHSVIAAACKQWPYDQKIQLSAFAFDTGMENEKTFVVAMVDSSKGKILSSYKRQVMEETTVEFGANSLSIDTAPYQLAGNLRAFGVRFTSAGRGASCPEGIWNDELTLFAPFKDGLRPVVQGLAMTRSEALNGCFSNVENNLVFEQAKLFLTVAKTRSKGFNDLIVTAKINGYGAGDRRGENRTEHYTLRYNTDTYQGTGAPPWWFTVSPSWE